MQIKNLQNDLSDQNKSLNSFIMMNFNKNRKTIALTKKLPPIRENETKYENEDQSQSVSRVNFSSRYGTYAEHPNLIYQHFISNMLQRMQPRDQRVIIPYLNKISDFTLKDNIKQFDKWLGEMHFAISSASFKHYMTKQLTYEEVKVYFSQNLLLNLLLFLDQVSDNEAFLIMKYLNTRLIDNLFYMVSKYPISKQIKPNKKLREFFSSVDNMGNDLNDMLNLSSVRFVKKLDDDYTPQIMKTINYLIQITSEKCQYLGKQTTYYNAFYEVMQKIFESVQLPSEQLPQNELFRNITGYETGTQITSLISKKEMPEQLSFEQKNEHQLVKKARLHKSLSVPDNHDIQNMMRQAENIENDDKKVKRKGKMSEKQLKQYRQKVKKYTIYKINQKINPNTELYTQNQINNSNFSVKNTAILRLLTKWTSQLKSKIFQARQQIKNRSFRFKANAENDTNQFIKLNSSEKNDLYQIARKKVPVLTTYLENMLNECIQIQGSLAKNNETDHQMGNIPRLQCIVGKFCTRLQSAASTYIVSYLNKIIQSLLEIPYEYAFHEQNKEFETSRKKDVNFITFKVADLMRCKCHSKQSQILRILSIIKKISDQNHDLLKIIRIRDRLQSGTRDIMINIIFMNRIICQIQLAITDEYQEKQKMYDAFNHYLYQLRRSDLGPIMESACIWTHLDQRSKLYKKILPNISNQTKMLNTRKHTCKSSEMASYSFAFICSLCGNYYSYPTGLIGNKKCGSCKKYYQCNSCLQEKMSPKDRKKFLGLLSKELIHFEQDFEQWTYSQNKFLPDFAIFISKKDKEISYIFVQKLNIKQSIFYIKTEEAPISNKVLAKTVIILKGESKKQISELVNNYFIYEWKQKRNINKKIKSNYQIQKYQRLQKQRQEEEEKKRKQKEKIKQEIKAQKQLIQKKWGNLIPVEEQSGSQDDKPNKKKKKKEKDPEFKPQDIFNKTAREGKEGKDEKEGKDSNENMSRFLKILIPKILDRPNSAASKTSKGSKGSRASSKYNKIDEQTQTNVEVLTKISEFNSVRICQKMVGIHKYNLILNYYIDESEIREQLKQNYNKIYVKQLLLNKKEVLFLEESKINEQTMKISAELFSMNNKALSSVYEIYLDQNRLKTLDFIVNFPKLRVLHANHNFITEMHPLSSLANLTEIMLIHNCIIHISGLQNKSKLANLCLARNQIFQIENLNNLPKLAKLSLYSNDISEIKGLENLKLLKQCDLSMNCIRQINGLDNLTILQKLYLNSNLITEIKNLQNLSHLQFLDLSRNQIEEMKNMEKLTLLKYLNLEKNKISQIKQLNTLTKLAQLDLSKNEIKKIQNLQKQTALIVLDLGYNKIENIDFEKVQNLMNLQSLNLSFNRMFEINRKLVKFLPKLKKLNLINNPLDKKKEENFNNLEKMREKIIVMAIRNYCLFIPK